MAHNVPIAEPDGPREASSTPNTVFQAGDERLTELALQALAPHRAGWNNASAEALSEAVIMMVDDEPLNIEMTEAFLADAGYRNFVYTDDSRRAIQLMQAKRPGVLLLDLSMPHIDGLQILEAMREDAELRHLPVIVLTATTDPQIKLRALSAGAMDFLSKPVDPSELALRIRNTLAATAYREYLAHHDPMTGLANRLRFRQDMASVILTASSEGHSGALVHIGMDRLGPVNDALGRAVGDQLVRRLAKRLAHCVETEQDGELSAGVHSPALYRLDGDEFAVIVPQTEAADVFAAFITQLMEACTFPFIRGGQELFITCSMGIAVFPQDARQPDELVTKAGLALRHAKEAGRNGYEFFSEQLNESAVGRLATGADLRKALAHGELALHYLPVVELASGKLVACEAVAQWRHPAGRTVAGAELMALAAASDLGLTMMEWILEEAIDHMGKWAKAGLQAPAVGVPVSLSHVRPREVGSMVATAMRAGLKPGQVRLQLLQVPALDQLTDVEIAGFSKLREAGLRVALSHFGAGASSLLALRRMTYDEVQLDPQLLAGADGKGARELLRGVLALLQQIGVVTVACGVDDAVQLGLLKTYGAHLGQGAVFGGALSPIEFAVKWLPRGARPAGKA